MGPTSYSIGFWTKILSASSWDSLSVRVETVSIIANRTWLQKKPLVCSTKKLRAKSICSTRIKFFQIFPNHSFTRIKGPSGSAPVGGREDHLQIVLSISPCHAQHSHFIQTKWKVGLVWSWFDTMAEKKIANWNASGFFVKSMAHQQKSGSFWFFTYPWNSIRFTHLTWSPDLATVQRNVFGGLQNQKVGERTPRGLFSPQLICLFGSTNGKNANIDLFWLYMYSVCAYIYIRKYLVNTYSRSKVYKPIHINRYIHIHYNITYRTRQWWKFPNRMQKCKRVKGPRAFHSGKVTLWQQQSE